MPDVSDADGLPDPGDGAIGRLIGRLAISFGVLYVLVAVVLGAGALASGLPAWRAFETFQMALFMGWFVALVSLVPGIETLSSGDDVAQIRRGLVFFVFAWLTVAAVWHYVAEMRRA